MSYSDFTLTQVKAQFGLQTEEKSDLFAAATPMEPSPLLRELLAYQVPLALAMNTEKSRSELIIAPILVEIKRHFEACSSLFSGVDFTVDSSRGLVGICDFMLSASTEQLTLTAPVVTIVEAKRENLNGGLGQCIAEMVAAQIFNRSDRPESGDYSQGRNDPSIATIYGAVTTGNLWKFLSLHDRVVQIDLTEYTIPQIDQILGILALAFLKEEDHGHTTAGSH
jgi:hypothetical protein